MKDTIDKLRYFLYARKSSESEDKQVQSIGDQVKRLKEMAQRLGIKIIEIFTEAKSAKAPYARPVFSKMMNRVEDGEADGIVAWQFNRLSRNPIDTGHITWLLQTNKLKSIQTYDRQYLPEDNALLLAVEGGVANQFIIDLKKNVRRGIDCKLEKGWSPNKAALGYLNDKDDKTIVEDPERFPLMRKMWDLMLTGRHNPPQILKIANGEWGFRTRKQKRQGGKELSRSGIYRIFTNPFYYGVIEYAGKEYEGRHKAMVTPEEFDRVQILLGRKGKPRPKKHKFAFTGLIHCGECGCLYTAETKTKHIKSTGEIKSYEYYHCTRKRNDYDCSQREVIRVEDLERQITEEIGKVTILPEFKDWALEALQKSNDKEIAERSQIHETQTKTILKTQQELDTLTKMRYRELIDDEVFLKEKDLLQGQLRELKGHLRETETRAENWLELTELAFNFATHAREAFIKGDLETKKSILMAVGSNPTIKDGKLTIQASHWLQPIAEGYPALEEEYKRLEPAQLADIKARTEAFASVRSAWLRQQDSNLRPAGYGCCFRFP